MRPNIAKSLPLAQAFGKAFPDYKFPAPCSDATGPWVRRPRTMSISFLVAALQDSLAERLDTFVISLEIVVDRAGVRLIKFDRLSFGCNGCLHVANTKLCDRQRIENPRIFLFGEFRGAPEGREREVCGPRINGSSLGRGRLRPKKLRSMLALRRCTLRAVRLPISSRVRCHHRSRAP